METENNANCVKKGLKVEYERIERVSVTEEDGSKTCAGFVMERLVKKVVVTVVTEVTGL